MQDTQNLKKILAPTSGANSFKPLTKDPTLQPLILFAMHTGFELNKCENRKLLKLGEGILNDDAKVGIRASRSANLKTCIDSWVRVRLLQPAH